MNAPGTVAATGQSTDTQPAGIAQRHLLFILIALFALDNVLLAAFLGKPVLLAVSCLAAGAVLALVWRGERRLGEQARIGWRTLAICFAVAAVLLILGGEGRLLYANEDWQVRDAVLADMARHAWPFTYLTNEGEAVLRAPLGMYFLPALLGRASQGATDFALLGCNTVMLGLMLALAAPLFTGSRARWIALVIFVIFSGLDIIGTLLNYAIGNPIPLDHLEWAPRLQYSSNITLIFWVPQHALAGWFCALLYLHQRRGSVATGTMAAAVPLVAIWSPLAIMGAVPLIGWAGLRALYAHALRWSDFATALAALALALPALIFLTTDTSDLPVGPDYLHPVILLIFFSMEVLPFLWIFYRLGVPRRFGNDSLILITGMLLIMPLFHIGTGPDFVMRSSITPMAVMMAFVSDALIAPTKPVPRLVWIIIFALFALGAVTGSFEVMRALRLTPAPPPGCSLPSVWYRQTERVADISTYIARYDAIPAPLRPQSQTRIDVRQPPAGSCWSRPWRVARIVQPFN